MISSFFSKVRGDRDGEEVRAPDDVVRMVRQRYEQAAQARAVHDRVILTSMAFEAGKQWVEYNAGSGRLDSVINERDDRFYFLTNNQIRPLVLQNTVRATQTRPDVWPAPLTESDDDRLASEEARSVLAHVGRLVDRGAQLREWVHACQVSSTVFVKVCWDPSREADIAVDGVADNNGVATLRAPIGDVDESVLLPLDVYADPKAKRFHDCGWVIHAKVCSLDAIRTRYGKRGEDVTADTSDALYGGIEQRLSAIMDDPMRVSEAQKNAATVLEMWQRPSSSCPEGRLVTVAGNVLLRDQPWPYAKRDRYPFVPLTYQQNLGSIWGRNMVSELIPHQMAINRILSNCVARALSDKLTLLVREGSAISPDDYTNPRNYQKIYYNGEPPIYQTPPPVSQSNLQLVEFLIDQMENIAGVHDVSQGNVTVSGMAASAIAMLQQADQSSLSVFVGNIESALVELAEWELALYLEFGLQEPRLIGLDDQAIPGKAVTRAEAFSALRRGGQCRVLVTPGSGMPKTPEARTAQLEQWYGMGVFGPPASPGAVRSFLEEQDSVRSDDLAERVLSRIGAEG